MLVASEMRVCVRFRNRWRFGVVVRFRKIVRSFASEMPILKGDGTRAVLTPWRQNEMKTLTVLKRVTPVVALALMLAGCATAPTTTATPTPTPTPFLTVSGSAGITADDAEPFLTVSGSVGIVTPDATETPAVDAETESVGGETVPVTSVVPEVKTVDVPVVTPTAPVETTTPSVKTVAPKATPAPVPSPTATATPVVLAQQVGVEAKTSPVVQTPVETEGIGDVPSVTVFYQCFVDGVEVAYVPASQGCGSVFASASTPVKVGEGYLLPATSITVWTEHYVDGVLVEKRLGY